jgi:serine/threonine protein kinase
MMKLKDETHKVGFSELVDYGTTSLLYSQRKFVHKQKFIIMKKLGESLYKVLDAQEDNIRLIDVLKLGLQLIKLIEKFHEQGLLHLDIKVNNMLFGKTDIVFSHNRDRNMEELIFREDKELRKR